ncbi:hypothetical protein [Rhodopseudomonas sp. RCAM05734]|uniref:hypothetical protein n=1 Tax=Rhodopseudomonas sp. RCAM05734 TaxID=3457549 RepID=UPI0040445FEE
MVQMACSERIASIARRAIVAAVAAFASGAALAQNDSSKPGTAVSTPVFMESSLVGPLRQLTDPGGLRPRLEQAGLQFTFSYYSDPFGNPVGGVLQGAGYDGRFGVLPAHRQFRMPWCSGCGRPLSFKSQSIDVRHVAADHFPEFAISCCETSQSRAALPASSA